MSGAETEVVCSSRMDLVVGRTDGTLLRPWSGVFEQDSSRVFPEKGHPHPSPGLRRKREVCRVWIGNQVPDVSSPMGDTVETWRDSGMGWSLGSDSITLADFPALCGMGEGAAERAII